MSFDQFLKDLIAEKARRQRKAAAELRRELLPLERLSQFAAGMARITTRKPIAIGVTEQRDYEAEIAEAQAKIAEIERLQRLASELFNPKRRRP